MAKHWLIDAVSGPLELDPFPLDLTMAEIMADLDGRWDETDHPGGRAPVAVRP